jgi:MFS family permease
MPNKSCSQDIQIKHRKLYYGWIIVASCTLLVGLSTGMIFSYSVFFKPLADYFNWDRATVSFIYSAAYFIRGAAGIGLGWLADRYGARIVMIFCGIMAGLGYIFSSQVNSLWQMILTFATVEAIGLSGAFAIGTTLVSRWFKQKRGLALGIVSAGSGLGTLIIVPGSERLVSLFNWSFAFIIFGIAGGVITIVAALFLRTAPASSSEQPGTVKDLNLGEIEPTPQREWSLGRATRDPRLILIATIFFLFFFSSQIVVVHLVNYVTDIGISPLIAATLVSLIGAISIIGRITSGIISDKIGSHQTMAFACIFLILSFILLLFSRSLWAFYLFAIIFSAPYGAEIPQLPLFIGKYFGTKNMATLVGFGLFVGSIGGALGPWAAGMIFDITKSYQGAFIAGALSGLISLLLIFLLKRQSHIQETSVSR